MLLLITSGGFYCGDSALAQGPIGVEAVQLKNQAEKIENLQFFIMAKKESNAEEVSNDVLLQINSD